MAVGYIEGAQSLKEEYIMVDFLKYRYLGFFLLFLTFGAFIGGYFYKMHTRGYSFVYSVDFTGGTQVLLALSQPVSSEKIIHILDDAGFAGAAIREFAQKADALPKVLIRVKQFEGDASGMAVRIQKIFEYELPDIKVTIEQVDSVGAGIGESMRWKSTQAVAVGLLLMLLYIAFRFWSWGFAIGAVVSLFHDALLVLTVFLIFDLEISINVIGAILAVLGYSINDTIIIFSRIRENIQRLGDKSLEEIINISINETLRRTILTSFATTLVVISLVAFGGEVLRGLSLVLLIGFVFGTYSSIFIASPVMLLFSKRKQA